MSAIFLCIDTPARPAFRRVLHGTSGYAVASLVLAFVLGPIGRILSIVFRRIALNRIEERGEGGCGLAIAWMAISYGMLFVIAWYLLSRAVLSP